MERRFKRIDTTFSFGRAENYISKANFKGIKPGNVSIEEILKVDIFEIQKSTTLKGLYLGILSDKKSDIMPFFLLKNTLNF